MTLPTNIEFVKEPIINDKLSPKNTSNIQAWTKTGLIIPPPPKVSGVKIQSESSKVPEIGSISFSVKDAYKGACRLIKEYDTVELDNAIDEIINHIKNRSTEGVLDTHILTNNYNTGLIHAIVKELRHRGFTVNIGFSDSYIDVSWDCQFMTKYFPKVLMLILTAIPILAVIYIIFGPNMFVS